LYRAIDSVWDTVEFFFSKSRDLPAAKRFFKRALERHGPPDCVVIDGSQTNRKAIRFCDATNRLKAGAERQDQAYQDQVQQIPQQSDRAGSSANQASCAIHARF
jgi:putative transposase